jgi:hypothetical protein
LAGFNGNGNVKMYQETTRKNAFRHLSYAYLKTAKKYEVSKAYRNMLTPDQLHYKARDFLSSETLTIYRGWIAGGRGKLI